MPRPCLIGGYSKNYLLVCNIFGDPEYKVETQERPAHDLQVCGSRGVGMMGNEPGCKACYADGYNRYDPVKHDLFCGVFSVGFFPNPISAQQVRRNDSGKIGNQGCGGGPE